MTLVLTILTGGRPELLERTIASVERSAPAVVEQARVVALVNGDDEVSIATLRRRPWVDEIHEHRPFRLGIGEAISRLMSLVPLQERGTLLHLEDDWECSPGGWYEVGLDLLQRHKDIGQVRLRRHASMSAVGQATSRYHMVTRQPLDWQPRGKRCLVARAHYTFNPTLVRTEVARRIFPCDSEFHAAQKFHRTGLLAAQLLPGAFRHTGGSNSLRENGGHA